MRRHAALLSLLAEPHWNCQKTYEILSARYLGAVAAVQGVFCEGQTGIVLLLGRLVTCQLLFCVRTSDG